MNVDDYMQRPYTRILESDETGGWSARVLELEGCFSGGDTPDEANRNLSEAMSLWIESQLEHGYEIPEPIDPATRWDEEDALAVARREAAPAA